MALKRRIGAALSGFSESMQKELAAQKDRAQRERELDFLEEWRKAQTRNLAAEAGILEQAATILEDPNAFFRGFTPNFGPSGAGQPPVVTTPQSPPGFHTQPRPLPIPQLPDKDIPEGWKRAPLQEPVSETFPGLTGLEEPPQVRTPSPLTQPLTTTPAVPSAGAPSAVQTSAPGVTPQFGATGYGYYPELSSIASDASTRLPLHLLAGIHPYFSQLPGALGTPQPNLPYLLQRRMREGNVDTLLDAQRQIQSADLNDALGLGPTVTVRTRTPRGQEIEYQALQTSIFGQQRQPPGAGSAAGQPPGIEPAQPGPGRIGDPQTERNPYPGLTELPTGEFVVVGQPMSNLETDMLLGLSGVFNSIRELEALGLQINQLEGIPAIAKGWLQRGRAALQLDPLTQQYNILRQALAPDLRRLSGETGGRFTETDIEAAMDLIPGPGSSAILTQRQFKMMRDRIYALMMTAREGAPYGVSPGTVQGGPSSQDLSITGLQGTTPSGGTTIYRRGGR